MAHSLTAAPVDDLELWDRFVAESPQGTVFSSSAWLTACARAQVGKLRIQGVWKNGELVAGVSCLRRRRGPLVRLSTPALTPYGGFLYRPDPGKRHSEAESFNNECADILIGRLGAGVGHAFLVHSPGFGDIRPFTWGGWRTGVRYTYVLDITDTDALWDKIERRVRTVIRNAEKSLTLGGPVETADFIELYRHIYRDRRRDEPIPSSLVAEQVDAALGHDFAEMRTVRDDAGRVISSMVLVQDAETVYAWLSGSIPGENSSGAFSLLFWDAVERYRGRCRYLDMVGANIPSIAFFKKGFGGTLRPYYFTERFSSTLVRASLLGYRKLTGLFS